MSILSGFFKTRKYRKTAEGYKWQSEDTSSETVYMNDGNTAETNLGAIQGITTSLASTSSNYALAASAGKSLQGQVDELNSKLEIKDRSIVYAVGVQNTLEKLLPTMKTNKIYSGVIDLPNWGSVYWYIGMKPFDNNSYASFKVISNNEHCAEYTFTKANNVWYMNVINEKS